MTETTASTEVHRSLGGSAGFGSFLQGCLDRFSASYHPSVGQIEVSLRSSTTGAIRNGINVCLTPTGWRTVFSLVWEVNPSKRLTAEEIRYAATILERISADFQYQTPSMGEWSADRLRYEADKCYSATADQTDEVTA